MIFPDPPCEVAEADVAGYVDYWDLYVSDADEVVVLRHWRVGYVAGVDSAFDVFFGEGLRFDEILRFSVNTFLVRRFADPRSFALICG